MRSAVLFFGGLREFWWNARVRSIIDFILRPTSSDLFCYFNKNDEIISLERYYSPYLKSYHFNNDPPKFEILKNIICGQPNEVGDSYQTKYTEQLLKSYQKFLSWFNSLTDHNIKEAKITHMARLTDLYLKMQGCFKLMEEYELQNNMRYDQVIVARIDMIYPSIEFNFNDKLHFCGAWKQRYEMDCFYYGPRDLIGKICLGLSDRYGDFIDWSPENLSTVGEYNMGCLLEELKLPIERISYCPGTTDYGYELFKV